MDKNLIQITGNVDSSEIKEIQKILIQDNINVTYLDIEDDRYLNATGNDFLYLLFQDFNIYSFTRDYVISKIIESAFLKLNKVIKYFKNKNKYVESSSIDIKLNTDRDKIVSIRFSFFSHDIEKIKFYIETNMGRLKIALKNSKHNQTLEMFCLDEEVKITLTE